MFFFTMCDSSKSCGAAGICAVRVSMVFWKLGLRLSSNFTAKLAVISSKDEAKHGEISSMDHFAKTHNTNKKIRQTHTVSQNTYSFHSFIEPVFGLPQIPWNPSWSPSEENGRSQTKTLSWRVMRRKNAGLNIILNPSGEMKASWLPTYILDPSIQFWLLTPKGAWLYGFTSNQQPGGQFCDCHILWTTSNHP